MCSDITGREYTPAELMSLYGPLSRDTDAVCNWSLRGLTAIEWIAFMQDLDRLETHIAQLEEKLRSANQQMRERYEVFKDLREST